MLNRLENVISLLFDEHLLKFFVVYTVSLIYFLYSTEDINEMVSWTKQLIKKIDSIQASIAAQEALSNSLKSRSQCE